MNKSNYGTISSNSDDVQYQGTSNSPEFNSLCDNIVTNIYTINSGWKTLQQALKGIGTSRDNQGFRDKIHVTQLSTNQIISITPKDLNRLKMIIKKGDKQKEFQINKLTDNFTEAMGKYHSMQKLVASKMKANLPMIQNLENNVSTEDTGNQSEQLQLSKQLAFEQDLMIDRESRIRQIEENVLDINQIMRELSAYVHEQGEHVDTIENSIDHAAANVEEGKEQLLKASNYSRKYRKRLCILVLIALVIISVLVGIIVSSLKK